MPNIVDPQGRPLNLSSYQKNELYRKAQNLKQQIRDAICSRDETRIPNERNVDKMINSEFKNSSKVEEFKKSMQAIGADPSD